MVLERALARLETPAGAVGAERMAVAVAQDECDPERSDPLVESGDAVFSVRR